MTVNSMIAVFSPIMKSTMVLSGCEMQSAHRNGSGSGVNQHFLMDIETYDTGSRGPGGSLKMLLGIGSREALFYLISDKYL